MPSGLSQTFYHGSSGYLLTASFFSSSFLWPALHLGVVLWEMMGRMTNRLASIGFFVFYLLAVFNQWGALAWRRRKWESEARAWASQVPCIPCPCGFWWPLPSPPSALEAIRMTCCFWSWGYYTLLCGFPTSYIFVNITLSKISICLIFMCHLLLAGLRVPQAWSLLTPSSPCLLSSSHRDLTCSARSLSVCAWNILLSDFCTPGLHSRKYELHRKAFSDIVSLGSPLLPMLLINFYVLFS